MHLRGSGTFRPVSPVVFVPLARGISECERLEAQVRSGPLARETLFPYHPHVTVAHDLDEPALDAAFDALATYDARFTRLGLHPVRARHATASGGRSATTPSAPAGCPDRWSPPSRGRRPSMPSPKALFSSARAKRPFLDHLVRTVQRYQADTGDRLAAAVTFYWFLSLFPILLLAISLLGYVYGDQADARVQDALGGVLPPQLVDTLGEILQEAKGPAGVVGLLGTLYSGLGWIDALREAIRTVWHQNVLAGNLVVKKLLDVVVLVGLFATIAASVLTTGLVTAFTDTLLDLFGVRESLVATFFTRLLGYALALVADTALFLYLFARLSRVRNPLRRLLKGAVFGAVGFEVLKVLGGLYVARTTSKGEATYGTFAVVVGLLLFLNLFSRFLLLTSAFVVTAPYDSDVAPSGTASKEQARKAGIPEEFAEGDPDDPPSLLDDGSPDNRLQGALQGRPSEQDDDAGDGGPAPRRGPVLPTETAVQKAARLTVAAGGVVLLGVLWHVLGTVRRVGRRS